MLERLLPRKRMPLKEILSRNGAVVCVPRPDILASLTDKKEPVMQIIGCDRAIRMEPRTVDRHVAVKLSELECSPDPRVAQAAVVALQRHALPTCAIL